MNKPSIVRTLLPIAFCVLATFFLPGCADDDARQQIADTNAKLAQLQDSIGNINTKVDNQKLLDVSNKLDSLQAQINQLNGSIDTLSHNQAAYKSTQDELQQSIEQQIQSLQQNVNNSNSTPSAAGQVTAPIAASGGVSSGIKQNASDGVTSPTAKTQLWTALEKIRQRNFVAAIKLLQRVVATSGDASVTADATYYLAISYAANGQYKSAIVTGRKFINANPSNVNAPDALRVIYISQTQLGMTKSAAKTAALIHSKYPGSAAAKKIP